MRADGAGPAFKGRDPLAVREEAGAVCERATALLQRVGDVGGEKRRLHAEMCALISSTRRASSASLRAETGNTWVRHVPRG